MSISALQIYLSQVKSAKLIEEDDTDGKFAYN